MIVKKQWQSYKCQNIFGGYFFKYTWTGYFLFGIIPIYLRREGLKYD